jgi:NAD(P)-dependent dehydrogenase (short-subunit alcohol dehydrogenase family)
MGNLHGANVAITGAARGIGAATASALANAGARVAIGDLDLDATAETAARIGGDTTAHRLDVTDERSFADFLDEATAAHGPLDVLVNNAGVFTPTPIWEETAEVARRTVDVNLHGVITGTKLAIERMRPRHQGTIVNIASSGGRLAVPRAATYCATKFAVIGFSESVRAELKHDGVEVVIVMPGHIATAMGDDFHGSALMPAISPDEVAKGIRDALEHGRRDVTVPRRLAPAINLFHVLPGPLKDVARRVSGYDDVVKGP